MTSASSSPLARVGDLRTVGICGIGQMGSAAVVAFVRGGYDVLVWARNREKLDALPPQIERMSRWADEHQGPAAMPNGSWRLTPSLETLDVEADAVLECVAEDMDQKVELLQRFEAARHRPTLFLSATSGLSMTEMGQRSGLSDRLVGAHFWNPPHLIPVVEMVRGDATGQAIVDVACDIMRRIGKRPVQCADVPGFIGNRLMHAMWREALNLVERRVATPEDIDTIVRLTFALRLPALGPFENMDYVGLPLVRKVQEYLGPSLASNVEPSIELTSRIDAGERGVCDGKGFYDWSAKDAEALLRQRDEQVVRQLNFLEERDRG